MKKEEKLRYGYICAANMLLATLLLAALKFFVGWATGSIVILADATHSMTDVVVLFVAFLGIKFARKKPSKRFPYGYYKAESIAAFIISFFIIAVALSFFYEGYIRLFEVGKIKEAWIAASTAAFSAIASYFMAWYLARVGIATNMHSLIATSNERKMDSISSIVVMLAIIMQFYGIKYVEGIVTMGIAILILKTGIFSLRDSIASLMDVSPAEMERKVAKIIDESDIKGYKDLRLRKAGPFIFGEAKLLVDGEMNVERAHEIADEIERKVKRIEGIDDFITHIEPYEAATKKIAVPVENGEIASKFGRASSFIIFEFDGKEWRQVKKLKNRYRSKKVRAGLAVAKELMKEGVNEIITEDMGEIAYHTLKDGNVKIYYGKGNINEVMEKYEKGELQIFKKPKKVG